MSRATSSLIGAQVQGAPSIATSQPAKIASHHSYPPPAANAGRNLASRPASEKTSSIASLAGEPRGGAMSGDMPAMAPLLRTVLTIFQLCAINFLASFSNGIVTVGLPNIAEDIALPRALYLWPSSVYGLASGATLLLAGSVADVVGPRAFEIAGCTLVGLFTTACGLSKSGIQLVVFRACQGVAMSMHLTSSVALVTAAAPPGRARNLGFACLGLSQPLGFSFGLVLGGIMVGKTGWRLGFYLSGGAILAATLVGIRSLPRPQATVGRQNVSKIYLLRTNIDWVGVIMASSGLSLLAYTLALLSADLSSIHDVGTIAPLCASMVSLLAFPFWMQFRQKQGKRALIPNGLWRRSTFASVCVMVALSNGVMNSMELFSSLYFQEVQGTTPLFTSLRLLPNLLVGTAINLTVGVFVDRVSARWLVSVSSLLCAGAPMLMAITNPHWNYWYMEFWAQILAPTSGDVLFTVGLLVVSDEFPEETQALAGAVFNTMAQLGWCLGLGLCQVVALGVSGRGGSSSSNPSSPTSILADAQLLKGYRAGFWTMFACSLLCGVLAIVGLRKAGRVGLKRD